ncbi:MAG: hypothetical protein Q7T18_10230, partial [Sedimentisphaerales bacterium]|nr:hypothetical protein [Sedimentisphaerales bacterium]
RSVTVSLTGSFDDMENISQQLFRIKDLSTIMAESHDPAKRLKKTLGAFDLVLLGIGVIIGAGIFTTVGTAVAGCGSWLGS